MITYINYHKIDLLFWIGFDLNLFGFVLVELYWNCKYIIERVRIYLVLLR